MGKLLSVREELAGKTEMNEENENDLFRRLEEIESEEDTVESLPKADWIGIIATFFLLGVAPLLYFAFTLS